MAEPELRPDIWIRIGADVLAIVVYIETGIDRMLVIRIDSTVCRWRGR